MPLVPSKDCFPAPFKCHNCERKVSSQVKKILDPKEEYKRCGGCHLLTYCNKDCQREHWIKVHRKHCRLLSGKDLVKNNQHNAATCTRCIDQRKTSTAQLTSEKSPKTICRIEGDIKSMKDTLGKTFGFHAEGKECNCSIEFGLQLPFALGEVSGRYLEIEGTGLDAMLAHALSILNAMIIKCKKGEVHRESLVEFWTMINNERAYLWYDILIRDMSLGRNRDHLFVQVNSLQVTYTCVHGASNPWWKALKFSVEFIVSTNNLLNSTLYDSHSLEDCRFKRVKQVQDHKKIELQNQAIVSDKRMWNNFMLWPEIVNDSLALVLPPGIQCQNCYTELSGEVGVWPTETNFFSLPSVVVDVGDNGTFIASCPVSRNMHCIKNNLLKLRDRMDKDQNEQFLKEKELFEIEGRDCDFCLKLSLSTHRCSACLTVQYCSTVCQSKDLQFHKTVCSTWAKDKSRRLLGKGKQQDHWKKTVGEK